MVRNERSGVTSRLRPAPGRKRSWQITAEHAFPLPVIVDHMSIDPASGDMLWLIEATIDLVDGEPVLTRMNAHAPSGIDPYRMQRDFRWASPLDVVRIGVPRMLNDGVDPFSEDLPLTGFPEAAERTRPPNEPLSDAFLEQIARDYLTIGRGYARTIAADRHVSERTVVSWVEKARKRGILTKVPSGSYGGRIVPRATRRS